MKNSKIMEVAIEFADFLLDREVTKTSKAVEGGRVEETYTPHEYKLLRGELQINGEELFKDFAVFKLSEDNE